MQVNEIAGIIDAKFYREGDALVILRKNSIVIVFKGGNRCERRRGSPASFASQTEYIEHVSGFNEHYGYHLNKWRKSEQLYLVNEEAYIYSLIEEMELQIA